MAGSTAGGKGGRPEMPQQGRPLGVGEIDIGVDLKPILEQVYDEAKEIKKAAFDATIAALTARVTGQDAQAIMSQLDMNALLRLLVDDPGQAADMIATARQRAGGA